MHDNHMLPLWPLQQSLMKLAYFSRTIIQDLRPEKVFRSQNLLWVVRTLEVASRFLSLRALAHELHELFLNRNAVFKSCMAING